jgi:hypothetical protein
MKLAAVNLVINSNTGEEVAYRYADTNEAGSQFPFVNTVKPPVNRMTMHETRANQEVYPV